MSQIKDVAVAIVFNDKGQFLLGQRPSGKPYEGYWEFPGGKLETGETVWQALCRELDEELGLQPQVGTPWVTRVFTYPHATVRLHFWRVTAWQGQPHGREGQAFAWANIDPRALNPLAALPQPLLPASLPVLRWLSLPDYVVLSHASEMGTAQFVQALTVAAQAQQIPWLLLREPSLSQQEVAGLYATVLPLCAQYAVRLSVSSRHVNKSRDARGDPNERCAGATHIHYTEQDSAQLPAVVNTTESTDLAPGADIQTAAQALAPWYGASCHHAAGLAALANTSVDYAFLGSVLPTASHPGQPALGWAAWETAIQATPVPTYAIGGLSRADIPTAQATGGQGVALQRGFWERFI